MAAQTSGPRFFLSYSLTKALRPDAVACFVDAVNEVVKEHFDGVVIDPMVSQSSSSISGEVIESLEACDLLIAETTNAAPNVYYEIGFAEALGKPAVLFLDTDRNQSDSPLTNDEMRAIRDRVFGATHPSDLGDKRYLSYKLPDGPRKEDVDRLKTSIRTAIDAALAHRLGPEMMPPTRAIQRTFQKSQETLQRHGREPSKLWMINGMSLYVDDFHKQLEHSRMQVDESLYENILHAMPPTLRQAALAIADTTEDFEPFMLTTHEIPLVAVRARIFAFDGQDAFDTHKFERLVKNIWRHATTYQCYMIDREFALELMRDSGIQSKTNCQGVNIMSTGQSSAWYSPRADGAKRVGTELLTIDVDASLAKSIDALFHAIAERSVNVSALAKAGKYTGLQRASAVRRDWQKRREIGYWEADWNGRSLRSDRYYADYERHIRAWIPDYKRLIDKFLDQSLDAISAASHEGAVRIVEVGPGTGELTERLLQQITGHSRRLAGLVESYTLIEDAPEMLERMSKRHLIGQRAGGDYAETLYPPEGEVRIRVRPKNLCFLRGLDGEFGGDEPTVVLGSLVHHYIDALDEEVPCFDTFIEELIEQMPSLSQMVLAGLFSRDKGSARTKAWRDWMLRHSGLEEDGVDHFFEGNPEMQRCFAIDDITTAASKHGFKARFTPLNDRVPFGVLRLRRDKGEASTKLM